MNSHISRITSWLLFLLLTSCADQLPDIQRDAFVKFYGSYQNDTGRDVVSLAGGGYGITGVSNPGLVSQMVLIRTDEYGNQLSGSPAYYGGQYQTSGNVLLELSDGFLIGGTLTDSLEGAEFQKDAFLVRTDAAGNEIWSRRYGGMEDDAILHMTLRNDGGFVIAGKRSTNEQEDLWIFMVDETGEFIAEFTGSDMDDDDEANYVYNTGSGYLVACTYDDGAYEGTDFFVIFINEDCDPVVTQTMGTEDDDLARAILPFGDEYLVLGYTENTATSLNEVRLYSFSLEGNRIRNANSLATISRPGADLYGEGAVISPGGKIVVGGTIESNENRDMILLFLDSEGTESADEVIFGELGNQSGYSLKNTPGGGLIMVGTNGLEGNSVITLVRTNNSGSFN